MPRPLPAPLSAPLSAPCQPSHPSPSRARPGKCRPCPCSTRLLPRKTASPSRPKNRAHRARTPGFPGKSALPKPRNRKRPPDHPAPCHPALSLPDKAFSRTPLPPHPPERNRPAGYGQAGIRHRPLWKNGHPDKKGTSRAIAHFRKGRQTGCKPASPAAGHDSGDTARADIPKRNRQKRAGKNRKKAQHHQAAPPDGPACAANAGKWKRRSGKRNPPETAICPGNGHLPANTSQAIPLSRHTRQKNPATGKRPLPRKNTAAACRNVPGRYASSEKAFSLSRSRNAPKNTCR